MFFQLPSITSNKWKINGNGNGNGNGDVSKLSDNPIDWSKGFPFSPLGAKITQEAIIPKNNYIILDLPDINPPQFIIMPIKLSDTNYIIF